MNTETHTTPNQFMVFHPNARTIRIGKKLYRVRYDDMGRPWCTRLPRNPLARLWRWVVARSNGWGEAR